MGDIADQIVEGEICQICCCPEGIDIPARGYPFTCAECGGDKQQAVNPQHHATKGKSPKIKCPYCDKMIAEVGLQQHKAAKHMGNEDV